MPERSLIFPEAEFRERLARLQSLLHRDGLDALLLTTAPDIFYVTGFLTRFWESPARPWFLVVPASGEPIAVIPAIGQDLMSRTWIKDIRTWPAPDPSDDGVSLLAEVLSEQTPDNGRIGIPKGLETHLRMPLGDFERVADRLGTRAFIDGTNAIQRCREIKTEAEIEKLRAVCAVADRAFDSVNSFAYAGATMAEVFRSFQIKLLEEGADWVSYVAGVAAQNGYGDVISPASDTPMQRGDVLMLDTGAVKDGYFCDFNRNFAIGPVSDDTRRTHEALWYATQAALDQLRPGMRAMDAHAIIATEIERHGHRVVGGRQGHGLGLSLTEWPSFTELDGTELRAGMVLTLEPSAFVQNDRILVHEENIVLRDTGPELLSRRAPFTLPELL